MRPTREGSRARGLVTTGFGFSPEQPVGDPVEPVDYLQDENARAWYPVSGGGTTALVQSKVHTPGSSSPIIFDASFDNPVEAGSLLVILAAVRSMSGSPSLTGWTAVQLDTNGFNSGDGTLFYKIADGTEGTGPFSIDCVTATQRRITMAEFSGPNGFVDSASTTGGASASYTIGDVTPTNGSATTLIAAALNSGTITGVTGYTTVSNGLVEGGINGPASILAYKAVDPASGDYNATVTQTSVDIRGGIHVAFSDIADPIWVPAPFFVDEDDATYHLVTGHTACARFQLTDAFQIGRARLVIGTETAGSKSYTLQGQTLADIDADTGTTIGTFAFTATGSFTADELEISINDADGYEFYRLVGPDENRRIYTLELYAPASGSEAVNEHIEDTTDAHDASAISLLDSAGWFTGTNVEAGMAELAAKAIGYLAHGNTGTTETFDAAIGWHSGTLNDNCTFTLTAAPSGTVSSLFLELLQDGTGGWTITLPASVANKAELEADQDTTADSTAFLVLLSRDGGTTWYGGWWGQSGGSDLTIEDEGTPLATFATTLDFVGAGVTASGTGAEKTITIPGATVTAADLEALGVVGPLLIADDHSTPIVFADLVLTEDGDDFIYADLGG